MRKMENIKRQMMKLWKDTFQDTADYIDIVFGNYFDENYIEYDEINGRVVSALMGVPYIFSSKISNSEDVKILKGLYLCGLATAPEARREGRMSDMIERINNKAQKLNFDFTFLIPSNQGLFKYYFDRGYVTAFRRVKSRYIIGHDFRREYLAILNDMNVSNEVNDKNSSVLTDYCVGCNTADDKIIEGFDSITVNRININNIEEINEVIKFISNYEASQSYVLLNHNDRDVIAVINENQISGGEIFIARNESKSCIGVAFVLPNDEREVDVRSVMFDSDASLYRLLENISNHYTWHSVMNVFRLPSSVHSSSVWEPAYGSVQPDEGAVPAIAVAEKPYIVREHAEDYGMIRVLNSLNILNFVSDVTRKSKNQILVASKNDGNDIVITTSAGKYTIIPSKPAQNVGYNLKIKSDVITEISEKELSEILFRPISTSNLISEALGLPAIDINMELLLD